MGHEIHGRTLQVFAATSTSTVCDVKSFDFASSENLNTDIHSGCKMQKLLLMTSSWRRDVKLEFSCLRSKMMTQTMIISLYSKLEAVSIIGS